MSLVIFGTIAAGLALIRWLDLEIRPGKKDMLAVLGASVLGSVLNGWLLGQGVLFAGFSLSLFMGCLLLACVTDMAIFQVYNFVWIVSGAAAVMLFAGRKPEVAVVWELLLFGVIQMALFARMYGKADCYAFCACAAVEAGLGSGMRGFLTHMLVSFFLLTAVQAMRKNIGPRGHLKKPVPFLPYITAGFYIILIFMKICDEIVVPLS